jgi:replicative DNA helicase
MSIIEQIPPQNIQAECAVLGSILLDNEMISALDGIISSTDFYVEAHKKIYKVIEQNHTKTPIELITLTTILRDQGILDAVGGTAYIAGLVDNIPSAANIVQYANIVKENSLRRQLLKKAYEIINQAYNTEISVNEAIENTQKLIMLINPFGVTDNTRSARDVLREVFKEIEARSQNNNNIVGMSTGLSDLDDLTGGLHPGELTIIAGRPGMGKSCLGVNIAHAAGLRGEPSLINSLEMPNETLMIRILASTTKIESRQIRRGFIRNDDWPKMTAAAGVISDSPIYFDDSPNITPAELRTRARRAKKNRDIKLIVVDYIQLMANNLATHNRSRDQLVAEISGTLKALARELNIPVIGISQLNRKVDERTDRRPLLSDLRESGAIEQDADLILFLYRSEVYNKRDDNPDKGVAEIIIGKQRHGPTAVVKAVFSDKYQQFYNIAQEGTPNLRYRND